MVIKLLECTTCIVIVVKAFGISTDFHYVCINSGVKDSKHDYIQDYLVKTFVRDVSVKAEIFLQHLSDNKIINLWY